MAETTEVMTPLPDDIHDSITDVGGDLVVAPLSAVQRVLNGPSYPPKRLPLKPLFRIEQEVRDSSLVLTVFQVDTDDPEKRTRFLELFLPYDPEIAPEVVLTRAIANTIFASKSVSLIFERF